MKKCFDCEYYEPLGNVSGKCKRYPPAGKIDEYTLVKANNWCGEYKKKRLKK
jgi:hypothetical protein